MCRSTRSHPARTALRRAVAEKHIRALAAIACVAALAGCGGSSTGCSSRVEAALARSVGSRTASSRLLEHDAGTQKCAYTAGAAGVNASVDTLPQAYRRWADSEVERSQNTSAWHNAPAEHPVPVDGVGLGAYWVRAERTLYAADERAMLIVSVRPPPGQDAEAIARAVAPAALRAR